MHGVGTSCRPFPSRTPYVFAGTPLHRFSVVRSSTDSYVSWENFRHATQKIHDANTTLGEGGEKVTPEHVNTRQEIAPNMFMLIAAPFNLTENSCRLWWPPREMGKKKLPSLRSSSMK